MRLKIETWLPLSSTARSRSSPFEIASAGPRGLAHGDEARRGTRTEAGVRRRPLRRRELHDLQSVLAVGDVGERRLAFVDATFTSFASFSRR